MFKKMFFFLTLAALLLTACAPSSLAIQTAVAQTQAAWTAIPSQTPYPTQTEKPTIAVTVVVTKIVTPTFTSTPAFTATITNTPTITLTQTPTADPLKASRGNGFYLVGVDIAPGVWRSMGTADDCYWEIDTRTGDIIDNHFGMAGGTMYIPANAFQVQLEDCGTWVFLSP